jgi:hypothetical protein
VHTHLCEMAKCAAATIYARDDDMVFDYVQFL